jgi:hypothetical protein
MAEILNRVIASLLVFAIVISLFGVSLILQRPIITYTGAGTTGVTNLTITSTAGINVVVPSTEFGSGTPGSGGGLTIASDNASNGGGFRGGNDTQCTYPNATNACPMVIENIGNNNVTLKINATKTNSTFIGGTGGGGPSFKFKAVDNESGSCPNSGLNGSYIEVINGSWVCSTNLTYGDSADSIRVHFQIYLPTDTPQELKTNTISFLYTAT